MMTDLEILTLARDCGFEAALLPVENIPVDSSFRRFCEENLCGCYGLNYTCPPECGTPDEMHEKLLEHETALVLKSEWKISSYSDTDRIKHGKRNHNLQALELLDALKKAGLVGMYAGCSHCTLCDVCGNPSGRECSFPERRFSCLSAYCVDVAELARRCGMGFEWNDKRLGCYSIIALRHSA